MLKNINKKIFNKIIYFFYLILDDLFGDKILKQELKIYKIKEKEKRQKKLNNFYTKYQKHPIINFNMSNYYLAEEDYKRGFGCIKDHDSIKNNWIKENPVDFHISEFIPIQQVIGSLGNYFPLFYYLIYKNNFEQESEKPTLLIKDSEKINNTALYNYFKPYLSIIENTPKFFKFKYLNNLLKIPLEIALPFKKKYYPWPISINFINQLMKKMSSPKFSYFEISEKDNEQGKNILKKMGIPNDAWYVTLHIKQGKKGIGHNFRNSDPKTYIKSIKEITSRGGYVIRVGDKSMSPLPKIDGLIDYPFTEYKSEFIDVFLGATCKFCLGTSSGYYSIPIFFNKPVLLVNFLNPLEYYSLKQGNMFLPKYLINKKSKSQISIKALFQSPISYYGLDEIFYKNNIEIIDNTEDEINSSTNEMFKILNGEKQDDEYINNNKKFKADLNLITSKDYEYPLVAMADLPSSFFRKYYK